MLERIRRILAPSVKRSLDAAGGGRRWREAPTIANTSAATLAASSTTRQRAQAAALNDPWAASAVDRLVANIVGAAGIKPESTHGSRDMRREIDGLFASWSTVADADGRTDFGGLQAGAVRAMIVGGEALLRFRPRMPEDGLVVPLQLQQLDAAQLDTNTHRDFGDGRRIRAGIEFDPIGRRSAYLIARNAPGDPLASLNDAVRVDASDIVHVFASLAPGQLRGLSWFASALMHLKEFGDYRDAQLVRQKVAALIAGFVVDPDGSGGAFSGDQTGSTLESGLEPGILKVLAPGQDIRFSEPAQLPAEYESFTKWQLRAIAASLGLTYEALTGDVSDVNYSSARVAILEMRRHVERIRAQILIPQLVAPTWRRFVDTAILAGRLPANDPDVYACKWISPAWQWVDPEAETRAEIAAVDAGFKSRSEVIAERGRDPEMVDAEIAADRARLPQQETANGNA